MSAAKALSLDKGSPPGADPRAPDPSMEDILASIRRIIADDQSRHASANGSPSSAIRRSAPAVPVVKAAAPPSVSPPAADKPPNGVGHSGPTIGRDTKDAAVALPHLNPPAVRVDTDVDRSVIDEIASAGVAAALHLPPAAAQGPLRGLTRTAVPAEPPLKPIPVLPVSPTPELQATATRTSPAPAPAAVAAPAHETVAKAVASEPAAEPMISSAADASIESSFNALATSVLMQNTGLVENMVRETLKPMLRQWLESNLPAIVERLVKVEIERVARGGRP